MTREETAEKFVELASCGAAGWGLAYGRVSRHGRLKAFRSFLPCWLRWDVVREERWHAWRVMIIGVQCGVTMVSELH